MNGAKAVDADIMQEVKFSDDISKLISATCKKQGFSDYKLAIKPIITNFGNFLGELYNVQVSQNNKDTLTFFVKVAPTYELLRNDILDINGVYNNEIFVYTQLKNVYEKLQEEFNVPESERYSFAKVYGSSDKDMNEVLIMENLTLSGYKVYPRMKPVTEDLMKEIIKTLAKFHALSFAADKYRHEIFEEQFKTRPEIIFSAMEKYGVSEQHIKQFEMLLKSCLSVIKPEHREALQKFCHSEEYASIPRKTVLSNRQVGAICHGDYRLENIFVQYDEDMKISSILPIDYQLFHYGPPVNDLIYLIFTASHTDLRRKCYNFWLDHYFKSLGSFLQYFSIDVETVYPEKTFREDVKTSLPYGLFVALRMLPMMLVDPKDVKNSSVEEMMVEASKGGDWSDMFGTNNVFNERISGIVEDYVNWGIV